MYYIITKHTRIWGTQGKKTLHWKTEDWLPLCELRCAVDHIESKYRWSVMITTTVSSQLPFHAPSCLLKNTHYGACTQCLLFKLPHNVLSENQQDPLTANKAFPVSFWATVTVSLWATGHPQLPNSASLEQTVTLQLSHRLFLCSTPAYSFSPH